MRYITAALLFVELNSSEIICLNLIIDEVREPWSEHHYAKVNLRDFNLITIQQKLDSVDLTQHMN